MHDAIGSAWAQLADSRGEPEVIPLFGRGHKTSNRAVVEHGRLVVTKEDAERRPNQGWCGDGTVPASDTIPVELDDRRSGWQAMTDRHQPMATATRIVDILRNLSGESIAARGAEQPDRPSDEPPMERARRIYEVLADLGIAYVDEPTASAPGRQAIRPPGQVLSRPRQGTCLDLAVVFAGACLDAGSQSNPTMGVTAADSRASPSPLSALRMTDPLAPGNDLNKLPNRPVE